MLQEFIFIYNFSLLEFKYIIKINVSSKFFKLKKIIFFKNTIKLKNGIKKYNSAQSMA
jgi:hypothetical protein